MTGDLDAADVERELDRLGAILGRPLSVVALTGSTSDDAKAAAAAGAPHGSTFIADAQTAGRGRGGHIWYSPEGESLYLSIVLRPRVDAQAVAPIALVVGVAVAIAIERRLGASLPVQVGIKWPNDLIVSGKKLGGVLVEGRLRGAEVASIVAGIGVNVRTESFPADIAHRATSLRAIGCADLRRAALAASIIDEIGRAIPLFELRGLEPFLGELSRRDALRDQRVDVGGVIGSGEGIDAAGHLLLRGDDGELHRVTSGEAFTVLRA